MYFRSKSVARYSKHIQKCQNQTLFLRNTLRSGSVTRSFCQSPNINEKRHFLQDAPEGVHKPADGQLNKSSHSSVLPDISSSRRSSSAPLHHHYRVNETNSSPASREPAITAVAGGNAVATSSSVVTEKTNAETQTALRGVAILENTECHAGQKCNESHRDHNTVFFTECECKQSKATNKTIKKPVTTKHSTSTPNISISANPTNRVARPPKKSSPKNNENSRNHSLSPTRRRSELPGSPDDQPAERLRPKRRNTVVSPIHVIHKKV